MLWPSKAANFNTLFDLEEKKDKWKNNPKLLNFYITKYAKIELHFVYFLGLYNVLFLWRTLESRKH